MHRAALTVAIFLSALVAPWPVTLALAALGAARFPVFVEAAVIFAAVEGAATPDRDGAAWLPLTAAALALAGLAEIVRPALAPSPRAIV